LAWTDLQTIQVDPDGTDGLVPCAVGQASLEDVHPPLRGLQRRFQTPEPLFQSVRALLVLLASLHRSVFCFDS